MTVGLLNPEKSHMVGIPGKHVPVLKSAYDNKTLYTTTEDDFSSRNNPHLIKAIRGASARGVPPCGTFRC